MVRLSEQFRVILVSMRETTKRNLISQVIQSQRETLALKDLVTATIISIYPASDNTPSSSSVLDLLPKGGDHLRANESVINAFYQENTIRVDRLEDALESLTNHRTGGWRIFTGLNEWERAKAAIEMAETNQRDAIVVIRALRNDNGSPNRIYPTIAEATAIKKSLSSYERASLEMITG